MVAGMRVTPQSQAFSIRLPFWGFVYNRPTAVLIERGGETERIPVVDVTRLTLIGLWGFSIVFGLLFIGRVRR
jgi:hypothetical protein